MFIPCSTWRLVGGVPPSAISHCPLPWRDLRNFPQGASRSMIRLLVTSPEIMMSRNRASSQMWHSWINLPWTQGGQIRHEIRFLFVSVFPAKWRKEDRPENEGKHLPVNKAEVPNKNSLTNCCSYSCLNYLFHILLNPSLCMLKKFPQNISAS